MVWGTVKSYQTPSLGNDKNYHYESIKHYFRKDVCNKNGYYDNGKNSSSKQKICTLCLSILEDIAKHHWFFPVNWMWPSVSFS